MQVIKAIKLFIFLLIPVLCLNSVDANSATYKRKKAKVHTDFTKSHRYAGLVVNADTGDVLYQKNASKQLHPASLAKLMTIYVTFKMIDENQLKWDDKLPVSIKAASQQKLNLNLKPNQEITVKQALLGTIVHSANDAAVVLAEAISGSESAFAVLMTDTAKLLGMKNTVYKNASGLPHSEQVTTAYDMAKLGIALRRDFPHYYDMFAETSFNFNGKTINGHNRVLQSYQWADGLKTGFVNASGFNLITSTNNSDGKLIGVVMGGSSPHARDNHMVKLLDHGYYKLKNSMMANNAPQEITPSYDNAFSVAATEIAKKNIGSQVISDTKNAFEMAAQKVSSKIVSPVVTTVQSTVKSKVSNKVSKKRYSNGKSRSKKISSKSKRRV